MSGSNNDGAEKTHDPTERRLEDARRKGDIQRAPELLVTASYVGLVAALLFAGAPIAEAILRVFKMAIWDAGSLSHRIFNDGQTVLLAPFFWNGTFILSAIVLVPAGLVLGLLAVLRAFIFTPDKLVPKLSRISPATGLRNRIGAAAMFEFLKNSAKLVLVGTLLAFVLTRQRDLILGSVQVDGKAFLGLLLECVRLFAVAIVILSLGVGIIDFFWQKQHHIRKLRMSRQELLDETKESEGDPYLKQARRQAGMDIATQRMIEDVPNASVVIVNPTHYAVALQWDRETGDVPICVAKGVDHVAARIREVAIASGVPIHQDAESARALHAGVEVGHRILPEHYRAVAAAIRYADRIRKLSQEVSPR